MSQALKTAVARQRMLLHGRLDGVMSRLETHFRDTWGDRAALEGLLTESLPALASCRYLYLLDGEARQVTANMTPKGALPEHLGRDRSQRPYLAEALAGAAFSMSPAYLSRNQRRPSLTAVRRLTRADGSLLGFLCADFDLRDLPLTRDLYRQPEQWLQMKGDPAIRGGLFYQQGVESLVDSRIDEVLDLISELILAHGAFHAKLHFSSSRATLWLLRRLPLHAMGGVPGQAPGLLAGSRRVLRRDTGGTGPGGRGLMSPPRQKGAGHGPCPACNSLTLRGFVRDQAP